MSGLLTVPSVLFGQIARVRAELYNHEWLKTYNVDRPVISIGNLTVGGTGKTPFSIWLLGRLLERGVRPAFASRGYGSARHEGRRVTEANPLEFGDEPSIIYEKFPQIPIYVGADRVTTIKKLIIENSPQAIVTDDAFQHRRLKRDLDIVLLDVLEPEWHYKFLPEGRAREDVSALKRAKFIVYSKYNLGSETQREFIQNKTSEFNGSRLRMNYGIEAFLRGAERKSDLTGEIYLVTGVGRPQSVTGLLGRRVVQHKIFKDHHAYSKDEAKTLRADFEKSGCDHFVTTAKDAVKLERFPELKDIIWRMDLSVRIEGDVNELDREIDRLVRSRL